MSVGGATESMREKPLNGNEGDVLPPNIPSDTRNIEVNCVIGSPSLPRYAQEHDEKSSTNDDNSTFRKNDKLSCFGASVIPEKLDIVMSCFLAQR